MKGLITLICIVFTMVITSIIEPIQTFGNDIGLAKSTIVFESAVLCDIDQPVAMSSQVMIITTNYNQLVDNGQPIILCNVDFQLLVRYQSTSVALYNIFQFTGLNETCNPSTLALLHHDPGDMLIC